MTVAADAFRSLPSVERLLTEIRQDSGSSGTTTFVVQIAREVIAEARTRIHEGAPCPDLASLTDDLRTRIDSLTRSPVRRVVNASGVIVHTNLGRAPLSPGALEAVLEAGRGYTNLEYEVEAGRRGSRHEHCAELLQRLTGAPASLVVNNNAAAVLLVLAELAVGREVVISRGELVEIGGGFRIPDVLRQSGARLVEVGTTNRTYAEDYATAVTPETGVLLRVHSSNFRVVGFTHRPALADLVAVGRAHDIPVVEDLGSGSLLDTSPHGIAAEPTVQESLAAGVDLVCFSGDKLLGGPQAGIVVGRAELVQRLKRHPLMRAFRPDKLTIAALAATLAEYARGTAKEELPVWRMISADLDVLEARGERILAACQVGPLRLSLVNGQSTVGGGALPEETMPSRCIQLCHGQLSATRLAARLRQCDPPIVGRIEDDAMVLDLRTVDPREDSEIISALQMLASQV